MHLANTSVLLGGSSQGRALAPAPNARGRGLLLAAGAAAAGAFLWAAHHRPATLGSFQQKTAARRRPKVNRLVVDALSGAVGEIASLVVLYPLDSLKVLCQARGCSAAAVLAELRAPGCNARMLRQLYAGCGSAALCSAAIGAVYLLAFYSAKRLGAAIAARGSASSAAVASPQQQQQQAGGNKAGRSGYVDGGSQLTDGSGACEGTNPLVASLAGVVASLAGSVFEAPMEMFKLRTQAGALDGPMLAVMLREASTRGLGSLYATYGAFMLKSVPYDVAELATYSQLCDWREAAAAGGGADGGSWRGRVGTAMAAMPSSASDMLIGAAAGVASVLVSMPCDTIKTRMDLLPPTCAAGKGGLLHSARAFFDTGRQLAAAGGGPGALFVGVAPRLLQTVPSTMVYWAAVEGTRRLMRKHFDVDSPSGSDSSNICTAAAAGASAESGASAAASGLHSAIVVRSSSSSSAAAPLGVAAVV